MNRSELVRSPHHHASTARKARVRPPGELPGSVEAVLLSLQRSAGNRAVTDMIEQHRAGGLRTRGTVGLPAVQRFWVRTGTNTNWISDNSKIGNYLKTNEMHRSLFHPRRSPVYIPPVAGLSIEASLTAAPAAMEASTATDLMTIGKTKVGRDLLASFATGLKHTTIMPSDSPLSAGPQTTGESRGGKDDPSDPTKGASAMVVIEPGVAVDTRTMGLDKAKDASEATWNPTRSDVSMFHELVHAHHYNYGTKPSGALSKAQAVHPGDVGIALSEYQATGLDTMDDSLDFATGAFTENKYRRAVGLPQRTSYIPEGHSLPRAPEDRG